jgi:hypothetical protein
MNLPDRTEIPFSRRKTALILVGGLLFVAAGAWLLSPYAPPPRARRFRTTQEQVQLLGLSVVVLFGVAAAFAARKLFDRRPALELGPAGLLARSSALAVGLVPWTDIAGFKVFELRGQRMVVVLVHDQAPYLARGGLLARAMRRANAAMCGSPITFASSSMRIDFDRLLELVQAYHAHYGAGAARASR